jgi:hypothetical protein
MIFSLTAATLRVLFVHLHAFDVRSHFREIGKGHVLKFLRACHGVSVSHGKSNPATSCLQLEEGHLNLGCKRFPARGTGV